MVLDSCMRADSMKRILVLEEKIRDIAGVTRNPLYFFDLGGVVVVHGLATQLRAHTRVQLIKRLKDACGVYVFINCMLLSYKIVSHTSKCEINIRQ